MGIYIPNMDKPKSCDKCPIRIAELFGVYYKDGKSKKITITGCDSSKYNGKTIAEEEKMMYDHCPLIEIDDEEIDGLINLYNICKGTSKVKSIQLKDIKPIVF